jgi:rare lipoprotein A
MKETQMGLAPFTSEALQGAPTASGQKFDNSLLVAAHPSYPMGTIVRVINLGNERAVEVCVIARSAPVKHRRRGYIIDLSRSAAERLDFIEDGKVRVRTEVLEWGGER